MGAVAAVHVDGAVVRREPAIVDPGKEDYLAVGRGPVVDGRHAAGHVVVRAAAVGRARADAGIGDRHGLSRAVVGRVDLVGPQDAAGAVFVMPLADLPILDPGDVEHPGDLIQLHGVGGDHRDAAAARDQVGANRLDRLERERRGGVPFDLELVEPRAVAGDGGAELVGRMEEAEPGDAGEILDRARLSRAHAYLDRVIGNIGHAFGAQRPQPRAQAGGRRVGELDQIVTARVLGVAGDGQPEGDVGRLAEAGREGAALQPDRRRGSPALLTDDRRRHAQGEHGPEDRKQFPQHFFP